MINRMSTFQISTEIPAPLDNVWDIVSDIDKEQNIGMELNQ